MRMCRFLHAGSREPRYGVLDGGTIYPVSADEYFNPSKKALSQAVVALRDVRLVAPVTPSKIVCVGRNYREHAAELGNKMPD